MGFAEAYTNTLDTQERIDAFASPEGQASVRGVMARIFSEKDASDELSDLQGALVPVALDTLDSSDATPFHFDVGTDSFLLFDDVAQQSHTWIENFSDDDTLQLVGVLAEDVAVSTDDQATYIAFDDGLGAVSKIALVGVSGDFTSVGQINSAGVGELTFE
ncbi:hypothetical protein HALO32_01349 [Halomonas lysinitropha]|uniref:Uncharacterized protein n=1 Tax=Halomonas lysinitropha TaxID=2607506 RepID=A0A5K1I0C9_9GAMM|nr:hypothetical protein [Halomonas lysinitropha]VVZ95284.1 hypothetical protein HALO32_01349 [Halomonas lysinitropha]